MNSHTGIAWLDAAVYVVQSIGFPAAVAAWLLYERYGQLKSFTGSIDALTVTIAKLPEALRDRLKS